MARRKSITSQLYRLARDSANVRAARRGPIAMGKRIVRRRVYRGAFGALSRVMRKGGL